MEVMVMVDKKETKNKKNEQLLRTKDSKFYVTELEVFYLYFS